MTRKYIVVLSFILTVMSSCGQVKKGESSIKNDSFSVVKSDAEWKKTLTENQYYILREKGTEQTGTGAFLFHKEKGFYTCAGCGEKLFSDDMKFESHCGWPSFDKEIAGGKIRKVEDRSHGMDRTEIVCAKCGGHLGHLFQDGPTITGLRYCVNGGALGFESQAEVSDLDTITLGGGCFWCMEAIFEEVKGVVSVTSGYSGDQAQNASYEVVSTGETNHAEVIRLVYHRDQISLIDILRVFFTLHDPTTLNRQGADVGKQYRSVIFYQTNSQKAVVEKVLKAIQDEKLYDSPIVTEIFPCQHFFKAEDYHQNYFQLNAKKPYCQAVIQPKLEKFEKLFRNLKK